MTAYGPRRSGRSRGGRSVDADQQTAGTGEEPTASVITDEERGERLSQLNGLIELMRPAVQADGGDLVLVRADVDTGVVEVSR